MNNIDVYYDEDFLYGECDEMCVPYKGHELHFRYKIKDVHGQIFHIYECKKCNALVAMCFFKGKQFSNHISFPHIFIKNHQCGDKVDKKQLLKILTSRLFSEHTYLNFKAGLFSGFPLCCISYFCLISELPADPGSYKQIKHVLRKQSMYNFDMSHVSCPLCDILAKKKMGKQDRKLRECFDASLYEAVISAFKWRLMSKSRKELYNEVALSEREQN